MVIFAIFAAELLLLFFLSSQIIKLISTFFLRITQSQKATIYLLSFLFFPGVVVHELAHFFVASILFVPTGDIEFVPKIQGDRVKLGSVAIAKTDPFRRMLIGVAPVLVGLFLTCSLIVYFIPTISFNTFLRMPIWALVALLYAVFQISNTMFSSKKDLEGSIEFLLLLAALIVISYILGFRLPIAKLEEAIFPALTPLAQKVDVLLCIPLSIDVVLTLLLRGVFSLTKSGQRIRDY